MLARWINKTQLKKVNSALRQAGYGTYAGDRTTAQPNGCGAGYAMNLINHVAGADPDAQREVKQILADTLN
jgi:hypothetical protein